MLSQLIVVTQSKNSTSSKLIQIPPFAPSNNYPNLRPTNERGNLSYPFHAKLLKTPACGKHAIFLEVRIARFMPRSEAEPRITQGSRN